MRLRRLQIQRYGHFKDATLDFPGNGIQVIHGQNEAGKSTLLQFIRELLFGFGERNKYDFRDGKLEGIGLLEFADQQAQELKRRKGRPDALTLTQAGLPESILEAKLQEMLGGANHQLFQNVFAFGLNELASGEESLRIEAVQNALHGSGSAGAMNPQKILDRLAKESEAIFKDRGSRQEVAIKCAEIKKQLVELREKTTKTETFLQLQRELNAARQTAEQFAEQLAELRKEQSRVKKLVTAFPLWHELLDLQEKRRQHGEVPHLPSDARQKFEKVVDDLKRLDKDTRKYERDIQTAETDLATNPAQTEWLTLQAQIEQARELIKSVQEARQDLPLRELDLASTVRQVEQGLRDVIADWTVEDLRAFRCDATQRFQCEGLVELKRQLETDQIRLEERESDLHQAQADALAELESIGEIPDVSRLQTLLAGQADFVAREAEFERLNKEDAKQQRTIATQIRKLTPPLPSGLADVSDLPVPPREEILVHQQELQASQARVTAAERSLDEAISRFEQLEQELQAARGSYLEEIPHRDGLRRRRENRDANWVLIRQTYVDGQAADGVRELSDGSASDGTKADLPNTFQNAIREADHYADILFDNASLVTKQEQVDVARAVVDLKRSELAAFQQDLVRVRGTWNRLWQPCGFVPLDPSAMLQWQATHEAILELLAKRDDLRDELSRLKVKSEVFQTELLTAMPESGGNLKAGFDAAQQRIAQSQQLGQDLKNVQKTLTKLAKQSELLKQDQAKFTTRRTEFTRRWRAWVVNLNFAADWQPELALDTVTRLQGLRDKLEQIPGIEARIAAIQKRLAEFDPLVLTLCEAVAPEWKPLPTEVAARNLANRLQSAITTDQRRNELSRELAKYQNKLADLIQQQKATQQQRTEWLALAGVDTDLEFYDQVQRAETIRELERQIEAKQKELDVARNLEDEATFLQQLRDVDYVAVTQANQDLETRLTTLAAQERQANQDKGAKENECAKLDGSSAAAEIQGQISNRRAALANAVDRYAPLLFAQHLLQQTLQRFERESQPEVLGEVSRLFAQMTGDRYTRVERPRDASRPLIVYRADQQDLEPGDLSMGTREQLYLAIRLAYVLHYCTKAEPLPIVLDDVFANFDPARTRRTLEALGNITDRVQVLLFTCHPHVVELAQEVFPDLKPVEVPAVTAL
ncbi:MAG: hypothetical protein JWM11_443 [Planctomycetaceae bacterium]|nr:hypothetical protein [Planctomycetaceae bacterium]